MYSRYNFEDEEFESKELFELNERIVEHNYYSKINRRKRILCTFLVVSILIYVLALTNDKIDSWLNALIWLGVAPAFSALFLVLAYLALDYTVSREYDDLEKLTQLKCKAREIKLEKEIRMLWRHLSATESMNNTLIEENAKLHDQLEELKHK